MQALDCSIDDVMEFVPDKENRDKPADAYTAALSSHVKESNCLTDEEEHPA